MYVYVTHINLHAFVCSVGRCLAWCTHGSHAIPVHTRTLRRLSATCNWPFVGGTLAVRQVAHSLLHLAAEGASSNVGPETVCRQLGLLWVSWVSRDKCWNTKAGDTLCSRHVRSRDVTSEVGIFNIEFWRTLTLLSLCLRHVTWRGALVGSHASTPLKFLLAHTFRETWRTWLYIYYIVYM
jgi:hypothetical protein